jgi:nitrogen regulatory protein P-II 1
LALISKRERENLGIVLTLRLKRQDNVYTLQNTNTTLMKKIEAIIRRTRFEDVKEALLAADIEWFSYYDVRGVGKTREGRIYRGIVYDTSSIERILISIVVRDKNVEKTVQAVMQAARTGEIGDGRIFIIPVEDSIRIRTGERGDIALYNAEQEK